MQGHQPHPVTPRGATAISAAFRPNHAKKRGNYNCGRCGLPKKGHSCHQTPPAATTPADSTAISVVRPPPLPRQPYNQLRRALSFDDIDVGDSSESDNEEEDYVSLEMDLDVGSCRLPANCLWEVLRRLPPPALLSAAMVCKGWRDMSTRLWRAAEELKLRVPAKAQVQFAGSVVRKCPGLIRLSLRMESDVDATMLACIAFSCPNLQSLEICTSDISINRITGGLRMLSLVLGTEITDASVAAIASSY